MKQPGDVRCPRCNALPGWVCKALTHYGKFRGVRPHLERIMLAEDFLEDPCRR